MELVWVSIAQVAEEIDRPLPSVKNAAFSLSASKPDIGPQSNPKARAARMKHAACSELLWKAFSSGLTLSPVFHFELLSQSCEWSGGGAIPRRFIL